MRLFKDWKTRNTALALMLAVVIPMSILASFSNYALHKKDKLKETDHSLFMAASFMETVLPDGYHDRIENAGSITPEEYRTIVDRNNELCKKLELEYLWSLMLIDGQAVFTSSTSPDKLLENGNHAAFFEVHTNPEIYEETFRSMEPRFQYNRDKWGDIRAVLIPKTDRNGRKYLIGASVRKDRLNARLGVLAREAVITSIVFIIPGILLSFFFSRWITRPLTYLAETAQAIGAGNYAPEFRMDASYELNVVSFEFEKLCARLRSHIQELNTRIDQIRELEQGVNAGPIVLFKLDLKNNFATEFISENISMAGYTAKGIMNNQPSFASIVPKESLMDLRERLGQAMAAGEDTYSTETKIIWSDGSIQPHLNWYRIIKDEDGSPHYLQGMSLNIKELKEARLRESAYQKEIVAKAKELSEFHNIVSVSPMQIYRIKLDDKRTPEFISDNYSIMGYDVKKLRSGEIPWNALVPEDDAERAHSKLLTALKNKSAYYNDECPLRWANGEVHWYHSWNQFIRDESGKPVAIQGIMSDITDMKAVQAKSTEYLTRLKAFASDQVKAEERERRQLAYVLHDDIGQMLAALNMKLSVMKESVSDEGTGLVQQVDDLMNQIMTTAKSLTWEISPTSLYETDIAAGLTHLAGNLKRYFDLDVEIETAGTRVELDRETSAFIFRCAKELLINTAKHSGVKKVEVGISQYGDKVHLIVSDQGKGFEGDPNQTALQGFGLFSIRERLEQINGTMHIESGSETGTKIMLIVPLDISALV